MKDDHAVPGSLSLDMFRANAHARRGEESSETEEESCGAFGYLRGVRDRALSLQLRYRNGNSDWFSYGLLSSWRYNPSAGLLLKFASDVVSLVLIRGSNLDLPVNGSMKLIDRGLAFHRVTWVREMDEDALKKIGRTEPVIDEIQIAEFESNQEAIEWVNQVAPIFVRS